MTSLAENNNAAHLSSRNYQHKERMLDCRYSNQPKMNNQTKSLVQKESNVELSRFMHGKRFFNQYPFQDCLENIYEFFHGVGVHFDEPIEETGSVPIKFAGRYQSKQKSEWVFFSFKENGIIVTFGSHHISLPDKTTRFFSFGEGISTLNEKEVKERDLLRENYHSLSKSRLEEENKRKAAQRDRALGVYMNANSVGVIQHPYIIKKRFEHTYELRLIDYPVKGRKYSAIVVPIYDFKYIIQAVQLLFSEKIDFGDGKPRNKHTIGAVGGHFYVLGQLKNHRLFVLCEGVATGFSIFESKFCTTLCCLSCTNYYKVTEELMRRFPHAKMIIACDNDVGTEGNPGVSHAKKIQEKYPQIRLLIPPAIGGKSTDLSDLFISGGGDE